MGRPHPRMIIPWLKWFVLVLNTVLFMVAVVVFVVSYAIMLDLHPSSPPPSPATESFVYIPPAVMFMGTYSLALTGIGFVCVFRLRPALIHVYAMSLCALFLMEFGTAAAVICYWKSWPQALWDGLTNLVNKYDPESYHLGVYFVQNTFDCCGVHNYTDWQRVDRAIPMSCCINHDECIVSDHNNLFQTGCFDAIYEGVDRHWCELITYCVAIMIYTLFVTATAWLLSRYLVECGKLKNKLKPARRPCQATRTLSK